MFLFIFIHTLLFIYIVITNGKWHLCPARETRVFPSFYCKVSQRSQTIIGMFFCTSIYLSLLEEVLIWFWQMFSFDPGKLSCGRNKATGKIPLSCSFRGQVGLTEMETWWIIDWMSIVVFYSHLFLLWLEHALPQCSRRPSKLPSLRSDKWPEEKPINSNDDDYESCFLLPLLIFFYSMCLCVYV